jgi:pyruvate formate lyase activating enzyme
MAEFEGPSGLVLQVQRMSTEDGPGLRSTAFLKGCPLECAWCHNPESIAARPEVQWIRLRCIGCGRCLAACGAGALARSADGAVLIRRGDCSGCGACAEACPSGAMELSGERRAAAALAAELLKDASYFKRSDRGGVTLSGGEASAQPAFAREVLRLCAEGGTHTALDTCGCASWESLSSLYPYTRLLLWDLKEIDGAKHEEFTGLGNELVLENLIRTAEYMRERASPEAIWVRTPVIPGATDTEANLYGLGLALGRLAPPRLERWELLAFNNLCADKYKRLGLDWAYAASPLMTRLEMERLAAAARRGLAAAGGVDASIVSWTGSTRLEPERN